MRQTKAKVSPDDAVRPTYQDWVESGTTLRTEIATQAMIGLMAGGEFKIEEHDQSAPYKLGIARAARVAVAVADALILELNAPRAAKGGV